MFLSDLSNRSPISVKIPNPVTFYFLFDTFHTLKGCNVGVVIDFYFFIYYFYYLFKL